ncbi:hypothetical protein FCV25MIE_28022 [Fagus crenata]
MPSTQQTPQSTSSHEERSSASASSKDFAVSQTSPSKNFSQSPRGPESATSSFRDKGEEGDEIPAKTRVPTSSF